MARSTVLFRAVTQAELASIRSLGAFSNPLGIETKYFSRTLIGARTFAAQAMAAFGDGPFTFVRTRLPTAAITSEMLVTVDRQVSTVVVPELLLRDLEKPVILGMNADRHGSRFGENQG